MKRPGSVGSYCGRSPTSRPAKLSPAPPTSFVARASALAEERRPEGGDEMWGIFLAPRHAISDKRHYQIAP